jgi:quercetin dioxygenase-like cupin family protein
MEMEAPSGTRDPIVVHSGNEARAVLIVLNPGQELGDHQVKENAWVTVLDGHVLVTAGGAAAEAGVGCLLRFDPDERHSLRSERGARILLLLAPWPGEGHYRGSEREGASSASSTPPTSPAAADTSARRRSP